MARHTLKNLQQILQDFSSVPGHFGALCIKRLSSLFVLMLCYYLINTSKAKTFLLKVHCDAEGKEFVNK